MTPVIYDLLHIIFKRKKLVGASVVLIVMPLSVMVMMRPTVYRAVVRLGLIQARAYPLISPKDDPRNVPAMQDPQVLGATVENLHSPVFIHDVSEILADRIAGKGMAGQASADTWSVKLAQALEVVPHTNAPFIDVAFRATNPDLAALVANTAADRYLYYQSQMTVDNPTLRTFYSEQSSAAERELREADESLVAFQMRADIFSLDDQKLQLSRAQMLALQALDENSAKARQAEANAKALTAKLKDLPPQLTLYTFEDDPKVSALQTKVVGLELDLNSNRELYTDEDRRVKSIVNQLELASQMLETETAMSRKRPSLERLEVNTPYQSVLEHSLLSEAEAESYRAAREELEHNVELTADRLRQINRAGYEYERLKSVRDAKKGNYDLVLARVEQARTSEALDQAGLTNVQIVDHAAVPNRPVPNMRLLIMVAGLMGAVVVGSGGAFGLEFLYTTVHGRRDAEQRLGIPVLGVIPETV